jgi:replicative DNA helicase
MNERIPPHDLGAERAVLGAMMLSAAAASKAVDLLRAEDFYRAAHGLIFANLRDAVIDQEPTDAIATSTRLHAAGDLVRVGGGNYLHDLIAGVDSPASVGWHARTVADRAQMRRLVQVGSQISQIGYDLEREPAAAAALATKYLTEATDVRSSSDPVAWADITGPAIDAIEAASSAGDTPGLSTGIKLLDAMTGGLRGGQLVVVGGRPAMGKSVLAIDWARRVAFHQKRPALIFSLEMDKAEIYNRIAAAETSVPLARITRGSLTEEQWTTIARHAGESESAQLFIDDSSPLTLPDIVSKARRLHARMPLGLVVVDYLQLLTVGRRVDNREAEVAEISRTLKALARELKVPVVAAAQLNRGVEARSDKRPLMSDLRESGAVEQDADIVILLYREDYYDAKSSRPRELDLIVAKHRAGPDGTVVAITDFAHGRLLDKP